MNENILFNFFSSFYVDISQRKPTNNLFLQSPLFVPKQFLNIEEIKNTSWNSLRLYREYSYKLLLQFMEQFHTTLIIWVKKLLTIKSITILYFIYFHLMDCKSISAKHPVVKNRSNNTDADHSISYTAYFIFIGWLIQEIYSFMCINSSSAISI